MNIWWGLACFVLKVRNANKLLLVFWLVIFFGIFAGLGRSVMASFPSVTLKPNFYVT